MKARFKAFAAHLALSVLIALSVIALVFFVWYPVPLHHAVGVTKIFLILLTVDVVFGPCLTLLVYVPGKKTLILDLTIIGLMQLSALLYGVYTVAEGRPAWLVFAKDRFDLVRINEIDTRKLDEASAAYRSPSWFAPQWAVAVNPEHIDAQNTLLLEAAFTGVDLAQRPDLYQPLTDHADSIRARILDLSKLEQFNPSEQVQAVLKAHPQADGWLPLRAINQDMVVLMRKDRAEVEAIVELKPWE